MTEKFDEKIHGRNKFDLDFSRIHEIIRPADVRKNDRIEARVRSTDLGELVPMQVWKLSSLGVELVVDQQSAQLEKGSVVDLDLLIAGQRVHFDGSVVDIVQQNDHIKLAGIRFHRAENAGYQGPDRRTQHRWVCSPDYYPTATCPTPGSINDHMYFKIRDISSEGMQLTSSLRNKILVPGMVLHITANFGADGSFHVPVEVTRVGFASEGGRDRLAIGTRFKTLTSRMKSIISQYLIQFSTTTTLTELKEQGLWPKSVSSAVDFSYLSTKSEYEEVKELRLLAHRADQNLNQDVQAEDMGDRYDGAARIIIGRHGGKVVCTVRVIFNTEDEPLEHEELLEWPDSLPRRSEIVEVSRLAIDPAYRHGDLLAGVLEFISVTIVQNHRYIVMSCLERMIPFFGSVGLKATGFTYESKIFNDEGHVLLGETDRILLGRDIDPIVWNLVYRRAADTMIEANMLIPTGIDRSRLATYRMLSPLAKLMAWVRRRRLLRR